MDELLKHLTEISIRQQQIVEHLATRQGQTEQELAALHAAAPRVPLPDARAQATKLLPKMTPHDDVEAFLQVFENTATTEGWPQDDWARALAPLLTGEAQRAYFALPAATADWYAEVKREILARLGLSSICVAQKFHEWEYKPRQPARAQAAELTRLAHHWLLDGVPSAAQVAERVVIDRLLRALPRAHRQAVGMRNPTTTLELVEAIELADAAQQRDAGERAPPFPRRVGQERRAPEGIPRHQSRPAVPSPRDEPMHQDLPAGAPVTEVKINGKLFRAILDSGSAVSLVQSHVLAPRFEHKSFLPITCVHGDTRHVPAHRVTITAAPGSWPVEVGIMKDLPVPVLIGRDWPGFDRLLAALTQPASPGGDRRKRAPTRRHRQRPVLLASDSGRDGESPSQNPNLFFDVFQQVTGGGSFGREQREDDRLKYCLGPGTDPGRKGSSAWAPSSPAFCGSERPAILCRAAEGGGKITASGASYEDGDRVGVGTLTPHGRTSRAGQHGPADSGPVPLAGDGRRGETVLPGLPHLPSDVTQEASPQPTDTAAHH